MMVSQPLRLLCVLAHPDDESLGFGGLLARYAAEGVETYLLTATRGERGWQGEPHDDPGPQALGRVREAELRSAAAVLGLRDVALLSYSDGELQRADPLEAIGRIASHFRQVRPQVVVTFGPDGSTGHPDHIAISQLATAAAVAAADASYRVAKLYYLAESRRAIADYESVFGDVAMTVDGVRRAFAGWDDWAITTRVDATDHWETVWRAVRCHRSQLPGLAELLSMPAERHRELWGRQSFYRAYSLVGGEAQEDDLFAGLR